jgi:methylated-DNA-[protein]-cysteine S-methyltransferase
MEMEKRTLVYGLWRGPVGYLGLVSDNTRLLEIVSAFSPVEVHERIARAYPPASALDADVIVEARQQLDDFFSGRRRQFDLPLDLAQLSPFTAKVLRILAQVPYGTTLTYGELATLAGSPQAARAVGRAMAVNPFPIIIPCHRVIGAGGKMTGYSGGEGIATKKWLLHFEAENR